MAIYARERSDVPALRLDLYNKLGLDKEDKHFRGTSVTSQSFLQLKFSDCRQVQGGRTRRSGLRQVMTTQQMAVRWKF